MPVHIAHYNQKLSLALTKSTIYNIINETVNVIMSILTDLIAHAKSLGVTQESLAIKAGIHPVSLSRAISTGNCQLRMVEKVAHALSVKITFVPDNDLAVRLLKGEVF